MYCIDGIDALGQEVTEDEKAVKLIHSFAEVIQMDSDVVLYGNHGL